MRRLESCASKPREENLSRTALDAPVGTRRAAVVMAGGYFVVSILLLLLLSWVAGIGEFSNDVGNAETCACSIPRSTVFGNDVGQLSAKAAVTEPK